MVREVTGAPSEGATMVSDKTVGCTPAFLTMWRSSGRQNNMRNNTAHHVEIILELVTVRRMVGEACSPDIILIRRA
ncbi:hypothetical protein TNCV_206251 [Trichonephila clavipes]|nr:hypothetical protein TNCV_206251 [Trichonephila clavipes]